MTPPFRYKLNSFPTFPRMCFPSRHTRLPSLYGELMPSEVMITCYFKWIRRGRRQYYNMIEALVPPSNSISYHSQRAKFPNIGVFIDYFHNRDSWKIIRIKLQLSFVLGRQPCQPNLGRYPFWWRVWEGQKWSHHPHREELCPSMSHPE